MESAFEFAAQDRADAGAAQQPLVEGGIQTVGAEVGPRIGRAYAVHQAEEKPGGGVHREEEGDQARGLHGVAGHRRDRHIGLRHVVAGRAQPRRRRGQTEGLAAHFVGGDQQDPHASIIHFAEAANPD